MKVKKSNADVMEMKFCCEKKHTVKEAGGMEEEGTVTTFVSRQSQRPTSTYLDCAPVVPKDYAEENLLSIRREICDLVRNMCGIGSREIVTGLRKSGRGCGQDQNSTTF